MIASELISEAIPCLKTSDTGEKALLWMDTYRISHLPVVNNEEFLGLVSDNDVLDHNCLSDPIGFHKLSQIKPFVFDLQHIFEVIEIVDNLRISVVPVLDKNRHFLGVITKKDLVFAFVKMVNINKSGAIIVLEMNIHDYSLSQIAQIVESNNIKILSLFMSASTDTTKMNITLKVDTTDISPVLQTFSRYNYSVVAYFLSEENTQAHLASRFDSFMNYLNM